MAVLAVAAAVGLVVGGSRWLLSRPTSEDAVASGGTSTGSETKSEDYDEDIHSLPSPTGSPADVATVTPPPPDPPIDMHTAFETGIFEGGPPAPSIEFLARNYWNGWSDGVPLSVFAGSPGYERMADGAVMVITYEMDGGYKATWTRILKHAGTLTVVRGANDGVVEMVNEEGDSFVYDLAARELHLA